MEYRKVGRHAKKEWEIGWRNWFFDEDGNGHEGDMPGEAGVLWRY